MTNDELFNKFSEDKSINEANTTGYDCFIAACEIKDIEIQRLKEIIYNLTGNYE